MLWINVICWAYLIFLVMGRIVNYDKCDKGATKARIIDNVMFVAIVIILIAIKLLSS